MSSRLGEEAVVRSELYPDAQPEYAFRCRAVVKSRKDDFSMALDSYRLPLVSSRPLQFESTPSPIRFISVAPNGPPACFYWRDQDHRVAHCWGPERLESGWWREREVRRDYYRVETENGQQFWIFRCLLTREWFLQGVFG